MTIAEIAGKVDSLTPAYCHLLKHTWDLNPTAFARAGNNLIVGFLDQTGIYTSSDNGDKWTKRWSPSGDNPMIYCMVKYGSTMLAGTASGLLRSTGQGLTWDYIQNDVLDYDVTSLLVGPDDVL